MPETEPHDLPPGPWRAVWNRYHPEQLIGFADAGGKSVMAIDLTDGAIIAKNDVVAAVEALPELVAATRALAHRLKRDRVLLHYETVRALNSLYTALARLEPPAP
jgi:hypothetical protein